MEALARPDLVVEWKGEIVAPDALAVVHRKNLMVGILGTQNDRRNLQIAIMAVVASPRTATPVIRGPAVAKTSPGRHQRGRVGGDVVAIACIVHHIAVTVRAQTAVLYVS